MSEPGQFDTTTKYIPASPEVDEGFVEKWAIRLCPNMGKYYAEEAITALLQEAGVVVKK
jgi:hypothetical protein